jgi:hypothetical protein
MAVKPVYLKRSSLIISGLKNIGSLISSSVTSNKTPQTPQVNPLVGTGGRTHKRKNKKTLKRKGLRKSKKHYNKK